jgi:hypothetical protein
MSHYVAENLLASMVTGKWWWLSVEKRDGAGESGDVDGAWD